MRITILGVSLLVLLITTANATLIDRGSGMIYDDVLDITWLQDANYAMTSGFDADGLMTWDDSVAWADNLIFGGFDDWRLASMDVNGDQSDTIPFEGIVECAVATEVECRDNELGYMYYFNLGGTLGDQLLGDQGLFTNIQIFHWSGTEYGFEPDAALLFLFDSGLNFAEPFRSENAAWAVRSGDVLIVPEPGTVALIGLGLAGVVFVRRRGRSGVK